MQISVDIDGYLKMLTDVQKRQIPFAISQTLNQIAYQVAKKEMPTAAERSFEGGATAWTKRGFYYDKATKTKLYVDIYTNPETHEYLKYQIHGGIRTPKKRKILIPTTNIRKNKFGNLTQGQRRKLFQDKSKYFQGIPKGLSGDRYLGVWERYGKGRFRMVAGYKDAAKYTKKPLEFYVITNKYVEERFSRLFESNMIKALSTAK